MFEHCIERNGPENCASEEEVFKFFEKNIRLLIAVNYKQLHMSDYDNPLKDYVEVFGLSIETGKNFKSKLMLKPNKFTDYRDSVGLLITEPEVTEFLTIDGFVL